MTGNIASHREWIVKSLSEIVNRGYVLRRLKAGNFKGDG